MYPTTVLPRDFLMARILRRRIARHTPSAMSRRDTASEINQWLKLGLNAAQIGEKLIPDDPTMTKEQMHAIIRARMAGAEAPPSAEKQYVLGQIPGQPAAGSTPPQTLPTPRLTPSAAPVVPAIQAPTQEQIERQADQVARKALADAAFNASLADTGAGQTAAAYAEGATLTPEQEMVQAEREIIEGRKTPLELLIEADPEAAAVQPESLEALVEAARPESLKARAEAAMKRLAVEAPSTATSADQVIDMYDKLVEASGPRGFFERLGFGMGARMDAVNKAFMANLNKSPLARKGSGAELRAATALVLQEARRVEAQRRRGHDIAILDERALNKEEEAAAAVARKVDAEARAADEFDRRWALKYDFADKKYGRDVALIGKRAAAKRPRTPSIEIADRQGLNDARKKASKARTLLGQNKAQRKALLKKRKVAALATLNKDGGIDVSKESLTNSEKKVLQELWLVQFAIEAGDEDITRLTANIKTYSQSLPGVKKPPMSQEEVDNLARKLRGD